MESYLSDYFRCPEELVTLTCKEALSAQSGYFQFEDLILYGRVAGGAPSLEPTSGGTRVDADIENGGVKLPFDLSEVISSLQRELYVREWRSGSFSFLSKPYYSIRPLLPVGIRRYLQKLYLRGWEGLTFPRWPVDFSVDILCESMFRAVLKASGAERIPFIWFWPEGFRGCAVMTHDVETEVGRDFCSTLMDIDDSFGIKASFQVIPEERYTVSPAFLRSILERGHEVAIHDLNHDGHLYKNRQQFVARAAKINAYGRQYGTQGFRAGVLYRKQVWYDELKFAYDMSVPNVAHLDPQRGGCCTVMPYFIGDILEIPVTTIQDYTMFNILGDFSTRIWREQTRLIGEKYGLMSFIIHPDYVIGKRERELFEELLGHIAELRQSKTVWVSTPSQVNEWWRSRAQMKLVHGSEGWRIENCEDGRARIAYAHLEDGRLVYEIEEPAPTSQAEVLKR